MLEQFKSSHLFQRVASFLHKGILQQQYEYLAQFSSLSESGFIPTLLTKVPYLKVWDQGSHLFQRVASFLRVVDGVQVFKTTFGFSSLSESGFIPTKNLSAVVRSIAVGSHLFQRVASFLPKMKKKLVGFSIKVLISFREWLHSYK